MSTSPPHWQCARCRTWTTLSLERHQCYFTAQQIACKEKYGVYPHELEQVFRRVTEALRQEPDELEEEPAPPPPRAKPKRKAKKKIQREAAPSRQREAAPSRTRHDTPQARADRNEIYDFAAKIVKTNAGQMFREFLRFIPDDDD